MPTLGIFHGNGASRRHKNGTLREHFVREMCELWGHSTPKEREKIGEHANIEMGCVEALGMENSHGELSGRRVAGRRDGRRARVEWIRHMKKLTKRP